jgi:lipid-A-disaccharide synthase
MRYYVIAGERSGDLHAGNLVKQIKLNDSQATFRGFGGEYMQSAGVELAVNYAELAFMGFIEVLKNLNTISKYLKKCREDIVKYNPDVVVLVDYGGFNLRIAKFCKKNNIKVFYYISPKVWAWNQGRAWKLKANVDRMFVILPFEKDFFKKFDWSVDYVGNPVLDAIKSHQSNPDFLQQNRFSSSEGVIALLPGSRKQELQNMIPVMAKVVRRFPQYQFGVATVSNLDRALYQDLNNLPNVKFIVDQTYDLLQNAKAALVTSGTATLETALFKVPQIVLYKTSISTYLIVKALIKIPYISLVNLISNRETVKELIQRDAEEENVFNELKLILSGDKRERMLSDYDEILRTLDTGSASVNAAKLMVQYMNQE